MIHVDLNRNEMVDDTASNLLRQDWDEPFKPAVNDDIP
jgi:hypothetical protein